MAKKAEKVVKVAKVEEEKAEKAPKIKPTKLEQSILDAIKSAKLGLPDWAAFAKQEHITLDYVQNRVDWMRRVGMIK
jgi:hypothetical protein